ncbi:MAG TPA: 30S ribosomal protein S5 [Planctomycetota bacterium]|nr:30S ribosomal protein S5 [Planctomycetota bacterium]
MLEQAPERPRPDQRGRGRGRGPRERSREPQEFEETVIKIYRSSKVLKGGRRFSFSALVVVGDRKGRLGLGYGKANEVPPSVEKAVTNAKKNIRTVPVLNETIPHEVMGRFGAAKVFMKPASAGTGVIAGASVKAIVEAAGIKNILTKSFGSTNPKNMAKAAMNGLQSLRVREDVAKLRGVTIE